jgi:hypothetical protein
MEESDAIVDGNEAGKAAVTGRPGVEELAEKETEESNKRKNKQTTNKDTSRPVTNGESGNEAKDPGA